MEQAKVMEFLTNNRDSLVGDKEYDDALIAKLLEVSDDEYAMLDRLPLRKPSTAKLLAVFPGMLGVDCFYLGDIKRGILKYFTFGGLFILWFKDIGTAKERCRAYNRRKLTEVLNDPSVGQEMIEKSEKRSRTFGILKKVLPDLFKALKNGFKDIQDTMFVK